VGPSRHADGVLLLDKPAGITSTRAMAMARRALGASKAGHTGTLDPFATGLLPLVFGEATKFSRFLLDSTKAYEATLRLGQVTETGDPEGAVKDVSDNIPISAKIEEVICNFVGDIQQIPPMHSAVHIAGKRLYEYAREGQTIPRAPRQVHVSTLEVLHSEGPLLTLRVVCSKGTYIRVLAMDIGEALGCGAYLIGLRRTGVGQFRLRDAATLEALAAAGPEAARERLLPVDTLVEGLPRLDLADDAEIRFRHGQVIDARVEPGPVAVFGAARGFLGVGEARDDAVAPLRLLADAPKSPDFA